jgi:predicted phosphodiesterase
MSMRIGFIGDVHGDLRALQWALETLHDVDRVVCLGDIVDGARDEECIDLLQARGVLVLQGNHDFDCAIFGGVRPPYIDWLNRLPLQHAEDYWHAWHSLLFTREEHVAWQYVYYERDVRRLLRETDRQVVLSGHTHVPAVHVQEGEALTRISKEELLDGPIVPLHDGCRYAVNVGRPTQCVVVLDETRVEYRFHSTPRFERRFNEPATRRGG